jgi:hypothetical protein
MELPSGGSLGAMRLTLNVGAIFCRRFTLSCGEASDCLTTDVVYELGFTELLTT